MDERGWTPAEVARRGGLPKQTLYRLRSTDLKRPLGTVTVERLARGLELPAALVRDAANESAGVRVYVESTSDADTLVVIATMEQLPPSRRRALRKMAEAMAEEYLGGQT